MATYPGGWLTLENSNPIPISNYITLASLYTGTNTDGNIIMSPDFCNPTGGTWAASPITLNAEPTVAAVNSALFVNEVIKSRAINAQTKMANLAATCPPPLQNMVYLYGNNDDNNLLCSKCSVICVYHNGKLIPKEKRIVGNRFYKCCNKNLKDNCPENDPNANNDPDSTWCRYNRNDPRCKIKLDDGKQVGRVE